MFCCHPRTRALLNQFPEDADNLVNTVMRIWLRRRSKLVHDYALVGFLLSPNERIMARATDLYADGCIFQDAVIRLIGKLLVPSHFVGVDRKHALSGLVDKFLYEHTCFLTRRDALRGDIMWMAAKGDQVQAHRWHQKYTLSRTKVLGRLACLVTSKILSSRRLERRSRP